MIWGAVLAAAMLSTCVLSLPVTSGQLENEDVKVVKCIVEVLVDVLSRPHPVPVSQECLVTLKTDDRLVRILRHRNFLKELQEIALQGGQERAQLQRDTATPDTTTQSSQTTDDIADRSMLEALGGPGERSILSQTSRTGNEDGEGEKDENRRGGESQESSDITEEEQVKRKDDESPESHVSESVDEWSDGKAEKRVEEEEDEEEESEEKRTNSKENSEEGNMTKDKSAASDEETDAPRNKSKEKKLEEEEEDEKRSALFSHKQDEEQREEGEMRRDSRESLKPWTKKGSGLQLKKKEKPGKEKQHLKGQQQEVPHHSKEVTEDEEEEEKKKKRNTERSPEEKELQLIARRAPEERRGSEEEGSASRKAEEPEIESLAAIESELENVAQKLHELWRGRERD